MRRARRAAPATDGVSTNESPRVIASRTNGTTSPAGGTRCTMTFRELSATVDLSRTAAAGRPRTATGGDAVPRNADRRPAHRHAAHAERSTTSGSGPHPVTLAVGFNRVA